MRVAPSREPSPCVCAEVGMSKARAFAYCQKALQAYDKAMRAGKRPHNGSSSEQGDELAPSHVPPARTTFCGIAKF